MAASGILVKGLPAAAERLLTRKAAQARKSRNQYLIELLLVHVGMAPKRRRTITQEIAQEWAIPGQGPRLEEPAGTPE